MIMQLSQCSTPSTPVHLCSVNTPSSLEELMPFPKAGPRKNGKGCKRMKSRILTDTPVCKELQQMKKNNNLAARKKLTLTPDKNSVPKLVRRCKTMIVVLVAEQEG